MATIAFLKLSELGAILLSYPLIREVRSRYPQAQLYFLTFKKNAGIFRLLPHSIPEENVIYVRDDSFTVFCRDTWKAIRFFRQKRIDIIFDLEFLSRYSAFLVWCMNPVRSIGFYAYTFEGLYRGTFMTHKVQYNPLSHVAKTYASLAQVPAQPVKQVPTMYEAVNEAGFDFPLYRSDANEKTKVLARIQSLVDIRCAQLVFMNPGEGMLPWREWPEDNFTAVARLLLAQDDICIVLVGTRGAEAKAQSICAAVGNPRCVNFVGQTTLQELMELFLKGAALVSNDCGLAHLAMLTPIPKFILFGPESPQLFAPLEKNTCVINAHWPCSPCLSVLNHRRSACRDNRCLKAIDPQTVYKVMNQTLQKSAHAQK